MVRFKIRYCDNSNTQTQRHVTSRTSEILATSWDNLWDYIDTLPENVMVLSVVKSPSIQVQRYG